MQEEVPGCWGPRSCSHAPWRAQAPAGADAPGGTSLSLAPGSPVLGADSRSAPVSPLPPSSFLPSPDETQRSWQWSRVALWEKLVFVGELWR